MTRHPVRRAILAALALLACASPARAQADAPAPPQGAPVVIGESFRIPSSVYGGERTVTVRLPWEYAGMPELDLPVVVMLDGGPEQDFPHIAGIAQSREMNLSFGPFILVGVETENRRHELTSMPRDVAIHEEMTGVPPGGADEFRAFLTADVLPWIEANYRTGGRRLLMGESLAGLFVLETFLTHPDLFDDYVAITPSLWWDEGKLVDDAPALLAAHGAADRRLYLSGADEAGEMHANLRRVVAALEAGAPPGLQWTYVDRSDVETHASIYHVAALDAFRAFFLEPARTGSDNPLEYPGRDVPPPSEEAQASMDAGQCTREIARPASIAAKNADLARYRFMCLLMKPGAAPTAGNLEY